MEHGRHPVAALAAGRIVPERCPRQRVEGGRLIAGGGCVDGAARHRERRLVAVVDRRRPADRSIRFIDGVDGAAKAVAARIDDAVHGGGGGVELALSFQVCEPDGPAGRRVDRPGFTLATDDEDATPLIGGVGDLRAGPEFHRGPQQRSGIEVEAPEHGPGCRHVPDDDEDAIAGNQRIGHVLVSEADSPLRDQRRAQGRVGLYAVVGRIDLVGDRRVIGRAAGRARRCAFCHGHRRQQGQGNREDHHQGRQARRATCHHRYPVATHLRSVNY